jgi:L-histidine N-alpha-methyltransferase
MSAAEPQISVHVHLDADAAAAMARDVRSGLSAEPKELAPKYFYDERGSQLFERITELAEYYPTRAERAILEDRAAEIVAAAGLPATLIELGSGSASKTRHLLSAMREAACLRTYVPVDISEEITQETAECLAREYPGLEVHGLVCDFEQDLERIPSRGGDRMIAFLGGTIGNLYPAPRREFLGRLAAMLGPGDRLLLGTDLVKERTRLEAAYDDAGGVTAEFNKNVLQVLNRELGADFDLDAFEHVALWDAGREWIEMRLRATSAQSVRVADLGLDIEFAAGEEMRTEVSAKFREGGARAELAAAGLAMRSWWTDEAGQFGLSLSAPA